MSAVSDVQDHLQSQGIVDGVTGWTSSRWTMHDEADQLVVITGDGGPPPEVKTASGMGDEAVGDVGVQVMVRAARLQGDDAHAKAKAVLDELHGKRGETIGATTYIRVRAMTDDPVPAGQDDNERPIHTVAFRMMRDKT